MDLLYIVIIYDEGKKIKISFPPRLCLCCNKVSWIKNEIKTTLGIDVKNQQLTIDGTIMQDDENIASYEITKGKEIYLNKI